ncbi:MAG: ABC transporter substrate-binding protein [Gemmatimonadales bacterium]
MRQPARATYLRTLPAISLFVIGCGERDRLAEGSDAVVIAIRSAPGTLFPPSTANTAETAVADQIFLKLAAIGEGLNTVGDQGFVPRLAESWEFLDDLTLVFHLDPSARWHDGQPVIARDVAFTFDLYRDTVVGASARTLLSAIRAVSARDSLTAEFKFSRAYPEQFYDATYHMRILPAHRLDTIPRARISSHPFSRNPIGTGPYRFIRWEAGSTIELEGVADHFLMTAGIGRQVWRVVPPGSPVVNQLLTGEVDLVRVLAREDVELIQESPDVTTVTYPSNAYAYLAFNLRNRRNRGENHPLFADIRLRRALASAIDRHAMISAVLDEYAYVPAGPTSRVLRIFSEAEREPSDTFVTRRLLAESGWQDTDGDGVLDRDGEQLAFDLLLPVSSTSRRRIGVILQERLRTFGVLVELVQLEGTTFVSLFEAGEFDAALGSWAQDPSPSSIKQTWSTDGSLNYSGYSNPAFDRLVETAIAERDPGVSEENWRRAFEVINADAGAVWLYSPINVAGVNARLRKFRIRPDQWWTHLHELEVRQ